MLNHIVIGPDEHGTYFVSYERSHLEKVAVLECRNEEQASAAAEKLNQTQIEREEKIRRDQILRGFRLFHPLLDVNQEQ